MEELQYLKQKREEIAFNMIEADSEDREQLEFELEEIEAEIEKLKGELNA